MIWRPGAPVTGQPLLIHWDGQNWHIAHEQSSLSGELFAVAVVGDKVWAVGVAAEGLTDIFQAWTPSGALIASSC